ncbi:MAG TPA: phage integrase SAM-like domain-containing protein [Bacteroidales bacterium]|nr:phage integrase SAM-like domain-containing protein [Bacteroidales bacterium]HRZ49232.1 phage integrase SAM-like domain-containing protein [Bacteroidales bacterium]
MPVYLRKKELKARSRYYLDIWHNGKRRYEMLNLYQLNSRHPVDVQANKEQKELAEKVRAKRELELTSQDNEIRSKHKDNSYFLEYFVRWVAGYRNKDVRLAKACYRHFLLFLKDEGISTKITSRQITSELVENFKKYLDQNLNGETPFNYFGKFIKLCHDATKAGLMQDNPCTGVKNGRSEGLKKDILSNG